MEEKKNKEKKVKKKKASMSFLTSLALSANNLRTKKGRTIMTAVAGSIGIIGIALIIALSSGVNDYIRSLEEETMAEYPIQITSSSLDVTSLLSSIAPMMMSSGEEEESTASADISVTKLLTSMFSHMSSNDLSSLKEYIDSEQSDLYDYVKAVEYVYNVTPLIYMDDGENIRQVNPDITMNNTSGGIMNLVSAAASSFYPMPDNEDLYIDQYDVVAGHWPQDYNECVLVLTSSGSVSDYLLYALGLRDYAELDDMIEQYNNGEDIQSPDNIEGYDYSDVLGMTYKVVNTADLYSYDEEYGVWVAKSDNEDFLKETVHNSETLTIVGVVQPKENSVTANLTLGINYPASLIYHMSDAAASSNAVLAQMSDHDINIFTGEAFGESSDSFDLSSLFSLDNDALADAFDISDAFSDIEIDTSTLEIDMSSMEFDTSSFDMSDMDLDMDLDLDLDLSDFEFDMSDMSFDMDSFDFSDMADMEFDMSGMDINFDMSSIDTSDMIDMSGFDGISIEMPEMDMSGMTGEMTVDPAQMTLLARQILSGYQSESEINFREFLSSESARDTIISALKETDGFIVTVDSEGLEKAIENAVDEADGENSGDTGVSPSDVSDAVMEYLNDADEVDEEELNAVIESVMTGDSAEDGTHIYGADVTQAVFEAVSEYIEENAEISITDDALDSLTDTLAVLLAKDYTESLQNDFAAYLSSDDVTMMLSQNLQMMIMQQMQPMMESMMETYSQSISEAIQEQMSAALQQMMGQAMNQMMVQIQEEISTQLTEQLSAQISEQMNGMMETMMESIMEQVMSQIAEQISAQMEDMMSSMMEEMSAKIEEQISSAMEDMMDSVMDEMTEQISSAMQDEMEDIMNSITDQISDSISDSFSIDSDSLMEAFEINMDSTDLTDLLTSMSLGTSSSYNNNLNTLGYIDISVPYEIDIYPSDFDSKAFVTAILDNYNAMMIENDEEEKTISYTDMVATMMSSITTIINVVSYVLIAFISVSLVVSCVMISIITQISVMERIKEIGILRAMGASKANISQVFIAETFIIGACSGLIGVIISRLLIIPINALIHILTGNMSVNAVLSFRYAAVLVVISVVITVLSGLVPAFRAAKQDPVTALRTE